MKTTSNCQEKRFLSDVENHQMTVIRDDENGRHLRFREPGTICCSFDLITWPGQLCITGDCGTYVFSRTHDMFEFFRTDERYLKSHPDKKLHINTGYWGEKLQSIGTNAGYEEYSSDAFEAAVQSDFHDWEFDSDEQREEVWQEVKNDVLSSSDEGEIRAIDAAMQFVSGHRHEFTDFWDHNLKEYTFSYLWCLYAIVWGISQYDDAKKKAAEAS